MPLIGTSSVVLGTSGGILGTTTEAAISAPDAFADANWSIGDKGTDGTLTVTISSLPANNGASITDVEYRIDGGTATSSGGTTSFDIGSLTNDTSYDVEIRPVNSQGAGGWSSIKSATPTTGSGQAVSNQTAEFGSATVAGEGGWAPIDGNGDTVLISSIDATSGMGAYTPSLSSGYLVWNATGAPDAGTLDLTLANAETITATVSAVTGQSKRTDEGIATWIGAASLSDVLLVRGYWATHNSNWGRTTTPSGTPDDGKGTTTNWITVKSHSVGEKFTSDMIYMNRAGVSQYVAFEDIDMPLTLTGYSSGHDAGIRCDNTDYVRFKNIYVYHPVDPGYDVAAAGARRGWFTYNSDNFRLINCTVEKLYQGFYIGGENYYCDNLTGLEIAVDCMFLLSGKGGVFKNLYFYNKRYGHSTRTVTAITRGNPTVVTVSDASGITTSSIGGFKNGTWGVDCRNFVDRVSAVSGNNITIDIDTSGEAAFGVGDTVDLFIYQGAHGDFIQIGNGNYDTCHDNMTFEGVICVRESGTYPMIDGQCFYQGDATRGIDSLVLRGMMAQGNVNRHISLANATNCLVECCTAVCVLGIEGQHTPGKANIIITGSGNIVRSSVANVYSLPGDTVTDNNATIAVTSGWPVDSTSQAAYLAAFDNPIITEASVGSRAGIATRFAPKTGGPLDQTIKIGAFPHYDAGSGTYTSPYP